MFKEGAGKSRLYRPRQALPFESGCADFLSHEPVYMETGESPEGRDFVLHKVRFVK